jgi:hypothetical protein
MILQTLPKSKFVVQDAEGQFYICCIYMSALLSSRKSCRHLLLRLIQPFAPLVRRTNLLQTHTKHEVSIEP